MWDKQSGSIGYSCMFGDSNWPATVIKWKIYFISCRVRLQKLKSLLKILMSFPSFPLHSNFSFSSSVPDSVS